MANPAVDPKAAPLADDLKEYALSLPTSAFPKNFFCALCSTLAIDSYKLLCCNKVICPSCQEKLAFPTTCPSCDHSPLEAESCTPNKALRNTMRIWLQKQKKKEEAKAAAQATPAPVETTPPAAEVQPTGDGADKPVESIEEAPKAEGAGSEDVAHEKAEDASQPTGSVAPQTNEDSVAPQTTESERRGSNASQNVTKSIEPSTADASTDGQNNATGSNGGMMGNNPMMMNGMGQMPYGFQNQAGFNNGMYGMNGMPNMMANGNWNGMNSMDFNSMNGMPNGIYSNYGGNMGMGMNDMSAMNYGGGYDGWNGMGGGYGNYNNGYNQMGGHNQSGSYPEMMNQFPKNNFSNQNHNHFPANQGGQYPQRNMRDGSHGGSGHGRQRANSRPGSRGGAAPNVRRFQQLPPRPTQSAGKPTIPVRTDTSIPQRDGQSPDGNANSAPDAKAGDEQTKASAESTEEGKATQGAASTDQQDALEASASGDTSKTGGDTTDLTEDGANEHDATAGLNPIQTFDSGDAEMDEYNQPMMGNGRPYQHGMMDPGFDQPPMDPSFDPNMGMAYNNYGSRGGFNNGAYGAAKVLTNQPTEPVGVGVAGAPTGPRAMREGRPNTGFSSRVNNARFNGPPPPRSITSVRESAPPGSPQRRMRSRSPLRDESMRINNKSPSRSPSRSRVREEAGDAHREASRSRDRESRREGRPRSVTPQDKIEDDDRKSRRSHRSSRHDERDDGYEDRHREEKGSRGDRTRSASPDRSSRRDKDKYRSSRSHHDRSKEHRRRHRSRSPVGHYEDEDAYVNGDKESDGDSRRKHRSDKDKHRDRSRDRERKDRKDRDRDYEYEYERKDKDRKRRRDREAEDDDRSSRRSRKDRDHTRERSSRHDERERGDQTPKKPTVDREDDIVGAMMKKPPASPPLNAPTGPAANGFSIKGRSKNAMPPPAPVQAPTGPRNFQPPKGPAANRTREGKEHRRKSSSAQEMSKEKDTSIQDHYAAERERNARERDSRERPTSSSTLAGRISSKRGREEDVPQAPRGPKAENNLPTGPREKRRKGESTDNITRLFTAGLRKNAKARRGGVRIEGDEGRDVERVERERERR